MSAFLGPIHKWLFGKIVFQNDLADIIEKKAKENNWISSDVDINKFGVLEQGALEDIVDETNIHGWLQERVSLVERKLAYIVTSITDGHSERITDISDIAYQMGKEHAPDNIYDARQAYEYLETILLNGMPCDRVNEVVSENDNSVVWQQTTDIHERYWEEVNGNAEYYDVIRESLIVGLFEKAGIEFAEKENKMYEIKKAA